MLFSSIPFLYYFIPCVLILYFAAPKQLKNTVLLISSLVFYAWDRPKFALLMIAAIVSGYVFGLLIEKFRDKPLGKVFLVLSVGSSLAMLGFFKYTDFFISSFNSVSGLSVPLTGIALPIGISFYTFQILSYTVDVYRGDVAAQRNPISLAAYVSMFPQLIAGPIVRYSDIEKQLVSRTHSFEGAAQGIRRFVLGLGKKILIANALGELCDVFRASDDKSVMFYWLYAVAFTLHIYFDFSGYSDMAIGMGKVFGFDFLENFDYPYISGSVTEFWRRWHMSLGSWFRDYVYIPLGGNRVSKIKWFRNIFVVWLLTGFWHGAAWNFIVWGLYFAVLLVLEKLWLKKYLDRSKVLRHIYVMFLVIISFVIFNAADMGEAMRYIAAMFGAGDVPAVSAELFYYLRSYAVVIAIAVIGSTPFPKKLVSKISEKHEKLFNIIEPIVIIGLMVVMTAYLVDGSFNPFLYFRF
ncbi:MAG: MBOAT family protein [Clostridia bacterium]|nr:MBOAT family protein [Clostridia bacterium]